MIRNVFSKRQAGLPDVFTYDELPQKLRAQIVHVLKVQQPAWPNWRSVAVGVAAEHGLLSLPYAHQYFTGYRGRESDFRADCMKYVLEASTEYVLDLIEVAFEELENGGTTGRSLTEATSTLNTRFRENGIGYQLENGQIVRVDSQVLHADVVKPALALLSTKGFEGPNEEFMSAHEHMRHGRIEEAITDACKAFESTMKAICTARQWTYDPKATAAPLIKTLIDNGLVPTYSTEQLEHVSKVLIGVATIRNKNSGHGAGAAPRDVPEHYAAYALHLAASNIVFLVECHNSKK